VQDLIAEKSAVLSKAQAFAERGMSETAGPLWLSAASYEERVAPLLEALGHDLEAALHRASAAGCCRGAGDPARAANLDRAALAGPLLDTTRKEIEQLLAECVQEVARSVLPPATARQAPTRK
jgi:hypothetical protein